MELKLSSVTAIIAKGNALWTATATMICPYGVLGGTEFDFKAFRNFERNFSPRRGPLAWGRMEMRVRDNEG
eukprot:scaffold3158_cov107-Skeletonema_dohrnii-CCMP3373.AAC.3